MKVLISPSKTINFDSSVKNDYYSIPSFSREALDLVSILKRLSASDLSNLMNISENLSELNYDRYKKFTNEFSKDNSKQAILIFKGDVYDPIKIEEYSDNDFRFLQNNLRILSGLYGLIKPMDLIKPYRLEMSIKLQNKKGKDLYQFWGNKIINLVNDEIKSNEVIINLASNEYFKAFNTKLSKAPIIDIDFKEKKAGQFKIIGIKSKKARGTMVNYIVQNKIEDHLKLKAFKEDGYNFNNTLSTDTNYVFTR